MPGGGKEPPGDRKETCLEIGSSRVGFSHGLPGVVFFSRSTWFSYMSDRLLVAEGDESESRGAGNRVPIAAVSGVVQDTPTLPDNGRSFLCRLAIPPGGPVAVYWYAVARNRS